MDAHQLLLPALAVLFLYETLVRAPRGWSVFHGGAQGPLKIHSGLDANGAAHAVWRFAPMLPPFGRTFLVPSEPFIVERRSSSHSRAQASGEIRTADDVVTLPNGTRCRFSQGSDMQAWVAALHRAQQLPRHARRQTFTTLLAHRTRLKAIRSAVESSQERVRTLRVLGTIQFFVIALPAIAFTVFGHFGAIAIYWLMLLLVIHAVLVVLAHQAHVGPHRWASTFQRLVSPIMCLRASEEIPRRVLSKFDPIAVALLLSSAEDFRVTARAAGKLLEARRELVRQLDEPLLDSATDAQEEALGRIIHAAGLRESQLAAPPTLEDPTAQTYCPSCEMLFAIEAGECADCGERLLRLDSASRAAAARLRQRISSKQARARR